MATPKPTPTLADLVQRAREANTRIRSSQGGTLPGARLERSVQQTLQEVGRLAQKHTTSDTSTVQA
jgi:hypothetical protein